MQPRSQKLLNDILDAAEFILEQVHSSSLVEYESNRQLNAAVERNFIIIGEAMSRLARVDSQMVGQLGNYPQIIGFRNVVVHGYDVLEHAIVWGVIQNEVPRLVDTVRSILDQDTPS